MTRTAFVLTETASGKAKEIASLLKHVDEVKAVHVVTDSYGVIALVEAGDSDGIRDIASKIALTSGVVRCLVCSERELTGSVTTSEFTGMANDDYCWCAREPSF